MESSGNKGLRDPKALIPGGFHMERNARRGTPYELTPDSRRQQNRDELPYNLFLPLFLLPSLSFPPPPPFPPLPPPFLPLLLF